MQMLESNSNLSIIFNQGQLQLQLHNSGIFIVSSINILVNLSLVQHAQSTNSGINDGIKTATNSTKHDCDKHCKLYDLLKTHNI